MMTDCCVTLRRVYLSGYHVIPLLLLRPGIGSWSDCHGGCCHVCAVHVLDRLVRLFLPKLLAQDRRLHWF